MSSREALRGAIHSRATPYALGEILPTGTILSRTPTRLQAELFDHPPDKKRLGWPLCRRGGQILFLPQRGGGFQPAPPKTTEAGALYLDCGHLHVYLEQAATFRETDLGIGVAGGGRLPRSIPTLRFPFQVEYADGEQATITATHPFTTRRAWVVIPPLFAMRPSLAPTFRRRPMLVARYGTPHDAPVVDPLVTTLGTEGRFGPGELVDYVLKNLRPNQWYAMATLVSTLAQHAIRPAPARPNDAVTLFFDRLKIWFPRARLSTGLRSELKAALGNPMAMFFALQAHPDAGSYEGPLDPDINDLKALMSSGDE